MNAFTRALALFRSNPLVALACLPPFFIVPQIRAWVYDKALEQELELQLRAVIPPDEIDLALEWIDDATARFAEMYADRPEPTPRRSRIMRRYLEAYAKYGEHPQ